MKTMLIVDALENLTACLNELPSKKIEPEEEPSLGEFESEPSMGGVMKSVPEESSSSSSSSS